MRGLGKIKGIIKNPYHAAAFIEQCTLRKKEIMIMNLLLQHSQTLFYISTMHDVRPEYYQASAGEPLVGIDDIP